MWLPPEYVEDVKRNNRIEDVASQYVKLGKSNGKSAMCLCPFHSERNPSCSINIEEQYFNCFTCHTGGDFTSVL